MRELYIWSLYTKYSFQQVLTNPFTMLIFLTGKLLRIGLFVVFLNFLFSGTHGVGQYNKVQIIFFYLSFNLIDTLGQFFFREVYRFRPKIVSGSFDFILSKPSNALLRVMLGGADVMDLFVLLVLISVIVWYGTSNLSPTIFQWAVYTVLILNALLIAASLHIIVLGLGIITTSIDHMIMVYRDLTSLLRIPVDLYTEPIRSVLTFVIPLGIMLTFPPKALMGLLSPEYILLAAVVSGALFAGAMVFWNYSLRHYQSASS